MTDVSIPGKENACEFCKPTASGEDIVDRFPDSSRDGDSWIKCDGCKQWVHYACVGMTEIEVTTISKYHCPTCITKYGPSERIRISGRKKTPIDYVALDKGDTMASTKVHPYCGLFKSRDFDTTHVQEIKGSDLTAKWASSAGLREPVIIRKQYVGDLDLGIPSDLDVHQVCQLIGANTSLEVIDVISQDLSPGWTMGMWEDYFYTDPAERTRINNVISLEFCNTNLSKVIKRPQFVRDMDLVDKVWPQALTAKGDFPKVKLYCLMSVQDSYTDFHIDFGGSSVFYHVCRGQKTFLFIPPSKANLAKYVKWCNSSDQSSRFFADMCSECYRVDLEQNDTLIIPSGWIHAVYTPVDTLVIGGNFLTPINMPMQIELTKIEKRTKVPRKFRFPHFTRVLWFTAYYYYKNQFPKDSLSPFEIEGFQPMIEMLQEATEKSKADEKYFKEVFKGVPNAVRADPVGFVSRLSEYVNSILISEKGGRKESHDPVNRESKKHGREKGTIHTNPKKHQRLRNSQYPSVVKTTQWT